MATFTWTPDAGATGKHQPRIMKAQFGDGYTQRAKDGLNSDMTEWSLNFSGRSSTESAAILAFMVARGGVESFDWSWKSGKKFICTDWTESATETGTNISATFQEVPK